MQQRGLGRANFMAANVNQDKMEDLYQTPLTVDIIGLSTHTRSQTRYNTNLFQNYPRNMNFKYTEAERQRKGKQ